MTGPIDANTKRYIDSRFEEFGFGTSRVELDQALVYLLRLLVEQRQMVLTERWRVRLETVRQAADDLSLPKVVTSADLANERLMRRNDWFLGAIRDVTADPTITFEEWFTSTRKQLEQSGMAEIVRADEQLPPLPSYLQDLF